MKVIRSTLRDIPEIEYLNKKYFKEIRDFKKIIESKDDYFYVLKENGKIIGFSGFHLSKWNNTSRIIDIFIRPDYRGKGCATILIKKIKHECQKAAVRSIIAEAPSLNNALPFYLKNGFRVCGFNDRYYSNHAKEIAIFLSFDIN